MTTEAPVRLRPVPPGHVVRVERVDQLKAAALGSRARDGVVRDLPRIELLGDERQETRELREHQHLLAAFVRCVHQLGDGRELGGGASVVFVDERGVAADLPELGELGEDLNPVFGEVVVGGLRSGGGCARFGGDGSRLAATAFDALLLG